MTRWLLFAALLFAPSARCFARASHSGHHARTYCAGCKRSKHGRIERSSEAKRKFMRQHPCPSGSTHGCGGYVIDHIVPLKRGGKDDQSNMQWQTVEAAKAKDKIE